MSEKPFNDILNFSAPYDALISYPKEIDFKDVMRGLVQNETWRDTTSNTLWEILGACGKDINNIVATGAIDYVQNLCDINTARIPALTSMAGMLQYDTGMLSNLYNSFPIGLRMMVDLFSVDREYLFGGNSPMLSIPMVRRMMERMKTTLMQLTGRTPSEDAALEDIFTEIKENGHRVSAEKYRALVKELFYLFILDILSARYSEKADSPMLVNNLLFKELKEYNTYRILPKDTILDRVIREESRHPLDEPETKGSNIPLDPAFGVVAEGDSLSEEIENMRIQLNVSPSFNAFVIAAEVNEHGLSPNNELTSNEKILVETVLNAHNKEMFDYAAGAYCLGEIETRYGYYREAELMKYLRVFTVMRSIIIQNIELDRKLAVSMGAFLKDAQDLRALDFYTYVENDWVYDDSAKPEKFVNEDGLGAAIMDKPIHMVPCKPKFVPRIGGYAKRVRPLIGYEYDATFGTNDSNLFMDRRGSWAASLEKEKPQDILEDLADAFTDLVFRIHYIRNELKRQAQFNAMRGSGSLLTHAINDFLLVKYPYQGFHQFIPKWAGSEAYEHVMKEIVQSADKTESQKIADVKDLLGLISDRVGLYRNYTNVSVIEYMDTTDYFNVQPTSIYTNDDSRIGTRYWETTLPTITNRNLPQVGALTPNDIQDFYRNGLSMGLLHPVTEVEDDVEEFLISLYESGAGEVHYDEERNSLIHPINDTSNGDASFAYDSRSDREKVQNNSDLMEKQDKQFLRYSSNTNLPVKLRDRNGMGQIIEAYNWKNSQYSSVMLHPFLYTFELWNPLVNILINAMSEYVTEELERSLTNKKVFDELYGTYGETKDFWKYNIPDFTGYMTRYEHEKHNLTDSCGTVSPLTGYDGLFYPSAIEEFVAAHERSMALFERERGKDPPEDKEDKAIWNVWLRFYEACVPFFVTENGREEPPVSIFKPNKFNDYQRHAAYCNMSSIDIPSELYDSREFDPHEFQTLQQIVASIYWQIESYPMQSECASKPDKSTPGLKKDSIQLRDTIKYQTYYGRWFSHLGYSDERCKRIAKQLWYWRDRIVDAATHRYAVCNYNLDLGNNSMFLMDTFKDEQNPAASLPNAIEALDKSLQSTNDLIEMRICPNDEVYHGRCLTVMQRPKELWIRWNAEPIALPAFDVYWNNDRILERIGGGNSFLNDDERMLDFGQVPYKNSTTNDIVNDIIERFLSSYQLDGSKQSIRIGNKAPIFYGFEQNADTMVFSMWDKVKDGQTILGDLDRNHLVPVHVLCREVRSSDGTYNFEKLFEDMPCIDFVGKEVEDTMLSPQQFFSRSRGSIIIPAYRTKVVKASNVERICIAAKEIICQTISGSNYETTELIHNYDSKIVNLRGLKQFGDDVCLSRGSSVVFSIDGDRIGFAFLGGMKETVKDLICTTETGSMSKYFSDSDPVERTAILRKRYYQVHGERDREVPNTEPWFPGMKEEEKYKQIGDYADLRFTEGKKDDNGDAGPLFNSFDRNDKFLCVVRFNGTLNQADWNSMNQVNPAKSFDARLMNITSDASYVPTFAYQSPNGFEQPEVSGLSKLHESDYLSGKDHWAIELLGLENPGLEDLMKVAEDLIITDETDNVKTYVNPRRIADALYRIWENAKHTGPTMEDQTHDMNIQKLYNPNLSFVNGVATWTEQWLLNEEGKDVFLRRIMTIVRCNEKRDGEALNEKNWFMQETEISKLFQDSLSPDDESEQSIRLRPDSTGFIPLPLDDFYTAGLEHGGAVYNSTSHILSGTQDPFAHAQDPDWPTTLTSPVYLLQYGNGIPGVRKMMFNMELRKLKPGSLDPALPPMPNYDEIYNSTPYIATVTIQFYKHDADVESRETPEIKRFMDGVSMIPAKSVLLGISEQEVERLADYHMLTHHDDIFYNIPHNDEDEILRADLRGRVHARCSMCGHVHGADESDMPWSQLPGDWTCPQCGATKDKFTLMRDPNPEMAANNPPKTFLDYLYIHEGSTAFKLDEQSPSHYTMQWDRPLLEIRRLLLNFRRNQLKCNGILPWSTFIMEERKADIDQGIPFKTIEVNATPGVDVKVKSEYFGNTDDFQAFILDAPSSLPKNCEVAYGSTSAAALNKIHESNYTIHTWENYVKDDGTSIIPVKVTNDEFKDLYKIYAQYVKTKDGFDLFFNMQNLFKPPFEYISSVTNQPMPLIPQDCYLYLNSTDKTSGRLTLYAQMKWLVNDITSSMKLIPLVTYDIYNISDDKPKFLLKNAIGCGSSPNTSPNVMLNIEDVSISLNTSDVDETGKLTKPIAVVQTLSTLYASTHEDYSKLDKLTFTLIQNDTALSSKSPVPSLNITSSLSYCFPISSGCATNFRPYTEMSYPDRTYPCRMNKNGGVSIKKEKTGHLVTFTYDDEASFTNEDLYLYWILPKGMDVMEAVAKLGCAFETDAIKCTAVMKNGTSATVSTKRGHVYINSIGKEKYLAKEHGKHYNKHGFVLKKASKIILDSIQFMQGQ